MHANTKQEDTKKRATNCSREKALFATLLVWSVFVCAFSIVMFSFNYPFFPDTHSVIQAISNILPLPVYLFGIYVVKGKRMDLVKPCLVALAILFVTQVVMSAVGIAADDFDEAARFSEESNRESPEFAQTAGQYRQTAWSVFGIQFALNFVFTLLYGVGMIWYRRILSHVDAGSHSEQDMLSHSDKK